MAGERCSDGKSSLTFTNGSSGFHNLDLDKHLNELTNLCSFHMYFSRSSSYKHSKSHKHSRSRRKTSSDDDSGSSSDEKQKTKSRYKEKPEHRSSSTSKKQHSSSKNKAKSKKRLVESSVVFIFLLLVDAQTVHIPVDLI